MMILTLAIFLLIYLALCFYVGYNAFVWLKEVFSFRYKKAYIACMAFIALNIFIDRFVSSKVLAFISGMWLLIIGYGLIILPIANLIYYFSKKKGLKLIGWAIVVFFIFVFSIGSYNAWNPVVRTYEVSIDKPSKQKELTILLASDFHIGKMVGKNHLERFVKIAKERQPDIILMPGDIIDDYIEPFLEGNLGETMKKLKAPLGVYATSGNHDYYGDDLAQLFVEMEGAGITMLSDEAVNMNDSFYIVGRNDLTDRNRKSIKEIVAPLNNEKPIIMLDHQPNALAEASENGVDLLLSGHTHGGQVAPANFITNRIYENDWGYLKKENLHSIVTSGFGFWGPPFRIGTRSEVVEIKMHFQ
ncbi:metallophosphoesterase [Bacillus sp. Bva_UNVM-123]